MCEDFFATQHRKMNWKKPKMNQFSRRKFVWKMLIIPDYTVIRNIINFQFPSFISVFNPLRFHRNLHRIHQQFFFFGSSFILLLLPLVVSIHEVNVFYCESFLLLVFNPAALRLFYFYVTLIFAFLKPCYRPHEEK